MFVSRTPSLLAFSKKLSYHGRMQPKIAGGGGAVRVSEGHPADDDDLASEKGHLLAKKSALPLSHGAGDHVIIYNIMYF